MPNWAGWQRELRELAVPPKLDDLLAKEIAKVGKLRNGANVILYASAFLQKPEITQGSITREDVNGFMNAVHGLDCAKGLVLIIHTPGGDIHAVESIVDYLHKKFDRITAIVPYLAMSGGSMISLACDEIILGKQSQLGPTDPQIFFNNKTHSARAIKDAFERAKTDIGSDTKLAHLWAPILQSMGPALILDAEKALGYSNSMVSKWLGERMFKNVAQAADKIANTVKHFNADVPDVYSHGQRIGINELKILGVNTTSLEINQELQEAVLSAYHLMTILFEQTPVFKFIATPTEMWVKNQQTIIAQPVMMPHHPQQQPREK